MGTRRIAIHANASSGLAYERQSLNTCHEKKKKHMSENLSNSLPVSPAHLLFETILPLLLAIQKLRWLTLPAVGAAVLYHRQQQHVPSCLRHWVPVGQPSLVELASRERVGLLLAYGNSSSSAPTAPA